MKNKFKIGDIVRYAAGPTALMKITDVSLNHGGHIRYYGIQFYGDRMGAYEQDCWSATQEEILKFKTDNHIGRLRDFPELAL